VLFVHGAHLGDWCWLLVMDELAKRGIRSRAVDLPFSGFDDDVACVRTAIEAMATHGAVHVVGHSYSGLVISAGGHAASHLTFIAARLPLDGESPATHTEEWGYPEFRSCMVPGDDGVVRLTDDARSLMYHRTSAPLAEFAMAHRRPMSSVVPDEPVADPAWMTVPSSYVVCGDDRAVRPTAQRERAALVSASTELDTDHSPFFSGPSALAGFLAAQQMKVAA
jgi:pimeloyl-ACP methyl ester carboxylesterase